jgi:hypothetical protein
MSAGLLRRPIGRTLALVAGLGACPALAGDKPATPEGAENLQAFFSRILPVAHADGPPFVTVKPEGADYLVSANLSALNSLAKAVGAAASYDLATLAYKLTEQDDGNWRVVQDSFPKVVSHSNDVTSTVEIANYRQRFLIDPKLAWWLSGSASADKGVVTMHAPMVDEVFDFGAAKGDYSTTVNANGTVSSAVKEEIGDVGLKISAVEKGKPPANISARLDKVAFNLGVDGLKSRKAFDLWALLAVHRDDLAQHEAELKELLREIAAPDLKLVEGGEASKALIASPYGAIALSFLKAAIGVANAGPQSAIDAAVTAEGLSLPIGLAPPGAADLTPSKIDVAATLKGIDIAAAANEAIADLHVGRPGPVISDEDSAKIATALLSPGPLQLEFAPSHIVAPALDADFQGAIRYAIGRTSGSMTIRMRNFDKTMAAIKGLGPDIERQAIPAVAMAKGLARTDSDGSLSWVVELGEDRSIKVNGIPLGKAPQ